MTAAPFCKWIAAKDLDKELRLKEKDWVWEFSWSAAYHNEIKPCSYQASTVRAYSYTCWLSRAASGSRRSSDSQQLPGLDPTSSTQQETRLPENSAQTHDSLTSIKFWSLCLTQLTLGTSGESSPWIRPGQPGIWALLSAKDLTLWPSSTAKTWEAEHSFPVHRLFLCSVRLLLPPLSPQGQWQ